MNNVNNLKDSKPNSAENRYAKAGVIGNLNERLLNEGNSMEMRIGQKGRVAPPPVLDDLFEQVSKSVASWDRVTAATHWHLSRRGIVDGVDFYVADRELGHIHLNGEVHLATDRCLNTQFVNEGRAEMFPFGGTYATWTLFRIRDDGDAEYAVYLFRQNYARLQP